MQRATVSFHKLLCRSYIWSCFGWGLQSLSCYHGSGELLPRLSTLTIRIWRYISVALAWESPPPDVIRHPALWSPDFPHLIKSAAIVCLTCRMFYCSVILNDCLWGIVILSTLQSPSGRWTRNSAILLCRFWSASCYVLSRRLGR